MIDHAEKNAMIRRLELEKTTLLSLMIDANEQEYKHLNNAYDHTESIIAHLEVIKDSEDVDVDDAIIQELDDINNSIGAEEEEYNKAKESGDIDYDALPRNQEKAYNEARTPY